MSSVFDPEVSCGLLYDQIALSKNSGAIGSTTVNLQNTECVVFTNMQDPDCGMLDASDKMMKASASDTHTKKTKGVSIELLENIWRINQETDKRTTRMKTQLNRQGVNSKLLRNFGTNDRMIWYRKIKSFSSRIHYLLLKMQQVQEVTHVCRYYF